MWLTDPVAPWHVGSSQTRARTHVPCIGRQILNHCATREAPNEESFAMVLRGNIREIKKILLPGSYPNYTMTEGRALGDSNMQQG